MRIAADIAGALVAAACVTVVVVRAVTAPAPAPSGVATPDQRAGFAATVAQREDEWRVKSAVDFPADHWSQRDSFHNHEATTIRELAHGAGVSYESVVRAIDEDVHRARGGDRAAAVVPCKPRPVFD